MEQHDDGLVIKILHETFLKLHSDRDTAAVQEDVKAAFRQFRKQLVGERRCFAPRVADKDSLIRWRESNVRA
jgi:hypothetical protein